MLKSNGKYVLNNLRYAILVKIVFLLLIWISKTLPNTLLHKCVCYKFVHIALCIAKWCLWRKCFVEPPENQKNLTCLKKRIKNTFMQNITKLFLIRYNLKTKRITELFINFANFPEFKIEYTWNLLMLRRLLSACSSIFFILNTNVYSLNFSI